MVLPVGGAPLPLRLLRRASSKCKLIGALLACRLTGLTMQKRNHCEDEELKMVKD